MVKPAENQEGFADRMIEMAPLSSDSSEHSDCGCHNCPVGCAAMAVDMQAWRDDIARYGDCSVASHSCPRVPLAVRCRCLECKGLMMHVCRRTYIDYDGVEEFESASLVTPCAEPLAPTADTRIAITSGTPAHDMAGLPMVVSDTSMGRPHAADSPAPSDG